MTDKHQQFTSLIQTVYFSYKNCAAVLVLFVWCDIIISLFGNGSTLVLYDVAHFYTSFMMNRYTNNKKLSNSKLFVFESLTLSVFI